MKHPAFSKQPHSDTGTFPFCDICAQFLEQSFDVIPLNVCAGWMQKELFNSFLMLTFHDKMMPSFGTIVNCWLCDFSPIRYASASVKFRTKLFCSPPA